MKNIINKIIDFFADISFKKKEYRPLTNETLKAALCENDFYQVCIKSKNNNIVARAISYFSGPYSHSVIVYKRGNSYYVNLFAELYELMRKYYKASFILYNFPELIVLASSDANGHNFFDLSVYERREMEIYELDVTEDKHAEILKDFIEYATKPYDSTGLVGQIFKPIKYIGKFIYKLFDDERAAYCSEGNYEVMNKNGIHVAEKKDPTPTQIRNYCEKNYKKVYDSIKKT